MSETPMMDELEKGPWPSFVKEIKRAAEKKDSAKDLLLQQEEAFQEKQGLWKHGGIVGVKGYGGGVIGRYHQRPEKFPNLQAFHTMRVNHPSGWFYTSDVLRKLYPYVEKDGVVANAYLEHKFPNDQTLVQFYRIPVR